MHWVRRSPIHFIRYQSPRLHNPLLAMLLKPPMNEVIELTHMKIYITDDTLILSGANLSEDYFEQRQDRYVQFVDRKLSDFCQGLVQVVARHSWTVNQDGSQTAPPLYTKQAEFYAAAKADALSYLEGARAASMDTHSDINGRAQIEANADITIIDSSKSGSSAVLSSSAPSSATPSSQPLPTPTSHSNSPPASEHVQTQPAAAAASLSGKAWVYPLIQMGPWGVRHDEETTVELLSAFPRGAAIYLATGYFNLTKVYRKAIMESSATVEILTASPEANGFLHAKGIKVRN